MGDRIKNSFFYLFQLLLDFLFPRQSLRGEPDTWITPAELSDLRSTPLIECTPELRARGFRSIDQIAAAGSYASSPLLRRAVQSMKYRKISAYAETLAQLVSDSSFVSTVSSDAVLCPVPLHWTRRFARGFNQADVIARFVSQSTCIPLHSLLVRTRSTGYQAHRSREQRLYSVRDAFRAVGDVPSHVVLVDDVATTGATLDACAETLKQSGAQHVHAWVVARG